MNSTSNPLDDAERRTFGLTKKAAVLVLLHNQTSINNLTIAEENSHVAIGNIAVVISMAVYECFACIHDLVDNAELFNPHTGRVLHLNSHLSLLEEEASNATERLHKLIHLCTTQRSTFVNPTHIHVSSKGPGILLAHFSNFVFAEQQRRLSSFTHFATIAGDMLFTKSGYADYIVGFDATSEGRCARVNKPDGRPYFAVRDKQLLAQISRVRKVDLKIPRKIGEQEVGIKNWVGLHNFTNSQTCLRIGLIDGMFWRRSIFATLHEALPFSVSMEFASDAYYPFNLFNSLINRTCKGMGVARQAVLPPPGQRFPQSEGFGAVARWPSYTRHLTFADVNWCVEAPPPDCFVLKGFHRDESLRRFAHELSHKKLAVGVASESGTSSRLR